MLITWIVKNTTEFNAQISKYLGQWPDSNYEDIYDAVPILEGFEVTCFFSDPNFW